MNSKSLQTGFLLKGNSYNYKIERVLGQGSFGITYLASVKMEGALGSIDVNIKVAIKEFFMRDINGRSDATVTSGSKSGIYDDYRRKFAQEALNLSKLQHPNIIKVIEAFEANNTIYYVMEFIGGGSLDDYIAKNNGIKEDEAIKIVKQIGSALSFMHKNKMLHLDLKPSNIMMKESGDIVLIDFGLSKQYDPNGEPESSTKVGAGTPGYAPIEQANYREGKGFPITMDVYALGGTMFKMLTGVRPPEASDILNDGFPLYELQKRHVSENIYASIAKAMAPTKKDRYSTVDNFINSFEEETVIDVEVASENVPHKENPAEKVFKVRPNTSKVTFEYHPRTPIFQGSYFCSVNKETGVIPNITQESTHIGGKLNEREYTKFLNDLQSLNLRIRDKEVPPYSPLEYSESPSELTITLYDENCKVYNKLWISGWDNELGNIDGELHVIEEKVRQIVPMLQEYIDGPYYEIPNYSIRINKVNEDNSHDKEKGEKRDDKKKNTGKRNLIVAVILCLGILSYTLWPKVNIIESSNHNFSPSDTVANAATSSIAPSYENICIGDYFYSDGSTSSVLDLSKNCIGVVYSLNPTDEEKKKGWIHGHIVAMEDVGNGQKYKWGPSRDLGNPHINIEYSKDFIKDRNGYVYTYEGLTNDGFPAFDAVRNFSAPLPSNTSGWYMPSVGQWYEILKSIGNMKGFTHSVYFDGKRILKSLKKISITGGVYMTSSESSATEMFIVDFDDDIQGFYAPYPDKSNRFKIRAVAAF